jgi:hypothetical protein
MSLSRREPRALRAIAVVGGGLLLMSFSPVVLIVAELGRRDQGRRPR